MLSNFPSYAPDFEDFILYYIFNDISKGFYIDVGANDPNYFSVTKGFYDRGWRGINIDPLPQKYRLLQKFRPRDINLQLAIGINEGNTTFRVHGFSSSYLYKKDDKNSTIINVEVKRMSNICRIYVPKGTIIRFCKIDVERAEKYVLLSYDFENYRPNVFCIESLINKSTNTPEYKEWEDILIKNDYDFIYQYKYNRFYYDKRISGIKDKFNNIDFYVEKFKH